KDGPAVVGTAVPGAEDGQPQPVPVERDRRLVTRGEIRKPELAGTHHTLPVGRGGETPCPACRELSYTDCHAAPDSCAAACQVHYPWREIEAAPWVPVPRREPAMQQAASSHQAKLQAKRIRAEFDSVCTTASILLERSNKRTLLFGELELDL